MAQTFYQKASSYIGQLFIEPEQDSKDDVEDDVEDAFEEPIIIPMQIITEE